MRASQPRSPQKRRFRFGMLYQVSVGRLFTDIQSSLTPSWGSAVEPATRENLRELHGMLRRLAADRNTRASGPARNAVPVQCGTSMFDLQRTPTTSMPRIRLRLAGRLQPAA